MRWIYEVWYQGYNLSLRSKGIKGNNQQRCERKKEKLKGDPQQILNPETSIVDRGQHHPLDSTKEWIRSKTEAFKQILEYFLSAR